MSFLDTFTISRPGPMKWEEMPPAVDGSGAYARACGKCHRAVFDLSDMTREEAEALLRADNPACVRVVRRIEDGKVMTRDCGAPTRPGGWSASTSKGPRSTRDLRMPEMLGRVDVVPEKKLPASDPALEKREGKRKK